VLGEFSREDRAVLQELLEPMAQAVECWLGEGIEVAMNRFNRKGEP
jgi:peptidyl-tRNA hydrolase